MNLNNESQQSNPDNLVDGQSQRLPFWKESVIGLSGREVTRIRSSLFYCLGLLSIAVGVLLFANNINGGFFFLTNSTILFLYPLVRFLFGGKDSLAGFILTIILDAFLKHKFDAYLEKKRKKRR
jgi:hypothetical protein